jgi:hypothetical protein
MGGLEKVGSFLLGAATAAALFGLIYGLPRLVRSAQQWTTAVLFSSLSGWAARAAGASSALATFWGFLLLGAFYSPFAAAAPDTIPSVGGVARLILAVDFWIVVLVIPLVYGAVESLAAGKRGKEVLRSTPAGLLHLPALSTALLIFLPWIVWSRLFRIIKRREQDSYQMEIEPAAYRSVVEQFRERFEAAGLPVNNLPASYFVRIPRWLVDRLGPPAFRATEPYQIRRLAGPGVQLIFYSTRLDLTADKTNIGRARSVLLGSVPPEGFWWTRSTEGRKLEAAILGRDGSGTIAEVAERLATLDVGGAEWRALQREYLLVAAGKRQPDTGPRQ